MTVAAARMGEIAISAVRGDELVALGLGSCIGLTLLDRQAGVAGLAHIVLPDSGATDGPAGKFANLAVPELIARMRAAGAVARRLEAILVGGAQMFQMVGGLDIGARNDTAVRSALRLAGVEIRAASTGGNQGRTVRVTVGAGPVTVKVAGGQSVTLVSAEPTGSEAVGLRTSRRQIISNQNQNQNQKEQ